MSIDEAQKEVELIVSNMPSVKSATSWRNRTVSSRWKTNMKSKTRNDRTYDVYVFNFSDNQGYAIVSSLRKVGLIALSPEGSLSENSRLDNPGAIAMLSMIENRLAVAMRDSSFDVNLVYGEWQTQIKEHQNGPCPVSWYQSDPFNEYCKTASGDDSYCGCNAVAIAQLMSIYRQPTSYNGYSLDWQNMINDCLYQDVSGNVMSAKLMQFLGLPANLDVTYTTTSGDSTPANIPRTFNNFGFSSGGTYNSTYNVNNIISELYTLHPVIIGGSEFRYTNVHTVFGIPISTEITYSAGHAWLVDGMMVLSRNVDEYDYEWNYLGSYTEYQHYFRCKFGWPFTFFDGYYLAESNAFDIASGPAFSRDGTETKTTEGSSLVFRYNLHSITGIRP